MAIGGGEREKDLGNIVFLGGLPNPQVIQHMRQSLCIFYPNYIYPETFGLVFAEANAVGTPVITHDLGAAREILGDDHQLVDATDMEAVVQRVIDWQRGRRLQVHAREEYRLSKVVERWKDILNL